MNEQEKKWAEAYDALEEHQQRGFPSDESELNADLAIISLLKNQGRIGPEPMPRGPEFTQQVMQRVRRRAFPIYGYLAMAAALLLTVLLVKPTQDPKASNQVIVDDSLLEQAIVNDARLAIHHYLITSEKLLVAIRSADVVCRENEMDLGPEKEVARELLVQHKLFDSQMGNPEFFQARHIVKEMERILVDINNLDTCSDPEEIDFINEHVAEERLLMKLRLIAQDIQVS